jgi:hypothetical protein
MLNIFAEQIDTSSFYYGFGWRLILVGFSILIFFGALILLFVSSTMPSEKKQPSSLHKVATIFFWASILLVLAALFISLR